MLNTRDQHAVGHPIYAPLSPERYQMPRQFVPISKIRTAAKRHYKPRYKLKEWVKKPPVDQTVQQWGGHSLVDAARAYMGTNPTGWSRVWCGRFMAMVAPQAAARIPNPNMARDWALLPRIGGCQIGAIAVLSRGRRGGHVGVVSDCTARGPKIVSGNHNRRVGEAVYPAGRIIAYVTG